MVLRVVSDEDHEDIVVVAPKVRILGWWIVLIRRR